MIDDDSIIRGLYRDYFARREEYDFYLAIDPEEGFKKAVEVMPDLIIMDLILPKNLTAPLDIEEANKEFGFKLLERIRKDERTANIPLVVFSNVDSDDDRAKTKELGANDYLVKTGAVPSQLMAKIESLLIKS